VPDRLPIYEIETPLLERLRAVRRVVLAAPTGSGKSTQVPQTLLRAGLLDRGQCVVLQPRRLAARLLAARVAEELGVPLGRDVGWCVRLEGASGPDTKILYVTEGILLRRLIDDPKLDGVACLLFDEFHERHLYGDLSLARALDLQERGRPDLLLGVMSATLDSDRLEAWLAPCAKVVSQGRMFPVDVRHAELKPGDETPPWTLAADAFATWTRDGGEGDVLVFMPGAYEISRTIEELRDRPEAKGFLLLPLHGELPPDAQDAAVARHPRRKIVVATNVAETSITIDGVRLVIDSGLARIARFDAVRGINTLLVEKISRASAEQRGGRAGRTAPGTCVRLWPARETRAARELPEVKRLDLSEAVLTLKAAGVPDLRAFRWLDAPEPAALEHAETLLADLGALRGGALTPLGRRLLAFPVHPRWSRLLLAAHELGCVPDAALVAALAQGREILLRNVDRATSDFRDDRLGGRVTSDFLRLMSAWRWARDRGFKLEDCRRAGIHAQSARQVGPLLDQFLRIAEREGLDVRPRAASDEALRRCLLIAFSDRVARRLDEGTLRCELVRGRRADLARESAVRHASLLVAAEIREIEGREVKTLLSLATEIEAAWLRELFPDDLDRATSVSWDSGSRRVIAEEQLRFRGLVLESKRVEPPPAEEAARLLAAEVLAGRLRLEGWDDAVEQWILRVNFLARACPELGIPPIGELERGAIMEQICAGSAAYRDVKDKPALPAARSWLNGAQQALVDKHAPERLELPTGRKPKVTYAIDAPPFIAVRIQDLFDVPSVPRLALGRVSPLVHILAPNQRPVQVTQDLAGFWRDHYPRVKKELQRKYPKHEWR
jgi:ATP-dependent helicase HrpB